MQRKKRYRDGLIAGGLIAFLLAPFGAYFLTPIWVNAHCEANSRNWLCGLGEAPLYAGIIIIVFLLIGVSLIAVSTRMKIKEDELPTPGRKR